MHLADTLDETHLVNQLRQRKNGKESETYVSLPIGGEPEQETPGPDRRAFASETAIPLGNTGGGKGSG